MSRAAVEPFAIVQVPAVRERGEETLGTKSKFWYGGQDPERFDVLFKWSRANEDWSEKVAAELAGLLGLPHARYEMATLDDQPGGAPQLGVISFSFLAPGEQLIHGNQVLSRHDGAYPMDAIRHAYAYTVESTLDALHDVPAPVPPGGMAADLFVGYLLLDAWIGNTDRHHENWGLIKAPDGVRLAPTFDHATCLGRELTPETARLRLETRDRRQDVRAYIARARSAFFAPDSRPGSRTIAPFDAWERAARRLPEAAERWRRALAAVEAAAVDTLLDRVPTERISDSHRALARRILRLNRERIEDE